MILLHDPVLFDQFLLKIVASFAIFAGFLDDFTHSPFPIHSLIRNNGNNKIFSTTYVVSVYVFLSKDIFNAY